MRNLRYFCRQRKQIFFFLIFHSRCHLLEKIKITSAFDEKQKQIYSLLIPIQIDESTSCCHISHTLNYKCTIVFRSTN